MYISNIGVRKIGADNVESFVIGSLDFEKGLLKVDGIVIPIGRYNDELIRYDSYNDYLNGTSYTLMVYIFNKEFIVEIDGSNEEASFRAYDEDHAMLIVKNLIKDLIEEDGYTLEELERDLRMYERIPERFERVFFDVNKEGVYYVA